MATAAARDSFRRRNRNFAMLEASLAYRSEVERAMKEGRQRIDAKLLPAGCR